MSVNMQKRFAVLILFFEKARQTVECVKSFLPSGVRIYILNNGSSERNSRAVEQFCKPFEQVTIFRSDVNLGVSRGRNFLIEKTDEEFLFFVDNDIVIKTANWVDSALAAISAHPDAEAFAPRMFNVWENRFLPCFSIDIVDNRMVYRYIKESDCGPGTRLNCILGGASIVKRTLFERLGLYDSAMFVGFEDYELALRGIRTQPIVCMPLQDIILHHDHAPARGNACDRDAVAVRYRVSLHEESIRQIRARHGVEFFNDTSWRKWVAQQQRVLVPAHPLAAVWSRCIKKIRSIAGRC
ncbi:MAG: glycosyltransferase [Deltaproteobacteria bacterium]|nr:glycosyltransferase [Deltaproteobacteria bacterium]